MFSGNQSISSYTPRNVALWMLLAFQGGVLNVGGFMACQRFVSHVTGFASYFGIEVSEGNSLQAFGMLLVPALYLCGAMISGQLVDVPLKRRKDPHYEVTFGLLFGLLLIVVICGFNGIFGNFGEHFGRLSNYVLLALLCLVCGIQNGTVTTVSRAVIRTTHLTGITTDLGIGIVRVLNTKHFHDQTYDEIRANLMRIGIIFFFCVGSAVGALVFARTGYRGFLLPTLITAALFIWSLRKYIKVRTPRSTAP